VLKILDFNENHIRQAQYIAKINYENEQKCIGILPEINEFPDFTPFVKNGLGVSAFIGEKMVGYLCCYDPFKNAFGTTKAIGVWSPLHGNGVIECDHNYVFSKMYQEAAKKWVDLNVTSHSITFYSNNNRIQNQLFRLGFGLRCIDAIREIDEINIKNNMEYDYSELDHDEFYLIFPIGLLLDEHLKNSPIFMCRSQDKIESGHEYKFAEWQIQEKYRYFAAKNNGKIIAYIKITNEGENFIGDNENMKHICGAFCLPEYRGQGIMENILNFLIKILKNENIVLLGTDFESFNPTANNFWLKYFKEYTHSVVRRIDDLYMP